MNSRSKPGQLRELARNQIKYEFVPKVQQKRKQSIFWRWNASRQEKFKNEKCDLPLPFLTN